MFQLLSVIKSAHIISRMHSCQLFKTVKSGHLKFVMSARAHGANVHLLHHAGTGHILRHGQYNEQCGIMEELRPINNNPQYSSQHQV